VRRWRPPGTGGSEPGRRRRQRDDALRRSLEQVGRSQERAQEILVTGEHLVVRVRTEGAVGVTASDVELATALDAVFRFRATGAEAERG